MKTKISKVSFLLILLLVIISSTSVQAASQRQKAIKAYKKYLSKSKIMVIPKQYEDGEFLIYNGTKQANVKFALIYLDNNNIPELLVTARSNAFGSGSASRSIWCIFGYKNGKVKRIAYNELIFPSIINFAGYYKKTSVYKTVSDDEGMTEIESYIKVSGSTEKRVASHWYEYMDTKKHSYYAETREVSKSTFAALKRSATKNKKRIVPKMYQNTSVNRKKLLR